MIEEKIFARLKTKIANVYPLEAPTDYKRPCAIYNRVSTEVVRDLDVSDGSDEDAFTTWQIDVYSTSFLEAKTIARAIKRDFRTWRDGDVETVAWIDEHSTTDTTTDTTLYRVMTFFKLFCAD